MRARLFNGRKLASAASRYRFGIGTDGQVMFFDRRSGNPVKVDLAGSNYGYLTTGRLIVALDGRVYVGAAA